MAARVGESVGVPSTGPESRRRLAAILSADAVGYSRRMAADEAATVEAIRAHRRTIGGFVREHGGRVVDAVGDNLLAEFASAVDAVACALAVQAELAGAGASLPEDERLRFRIGLHAGDVLADGEQIFGDAVNVAARLEALADPGGICASAAVVEQVRGKLAAALEDLGERPLKNIPVPVRAYRVHPIGERPDAAAAPSMTVAGFGGRPAIAVLPFENLSADPAHDYLADGIAGDLIARLSAFRLFPVISRSSTFTYRGRRPDAREVSRDLRARYVVSGTVRSAGGRVRVAVDLVDGVLGHQLHSERWDRELGDVFALQDDVVDAIVGSLEPALGLAERQRALAKPAPHLDAWESLQRGTWLLFSLRSKDEALEAIRLFRRAQSLDRSMSTASALESVAHSASILFQWTADVEGSIADALEAAERALRLDAEDPWAQVALGYAASFAGDAERAVAAFDRAIERSPSLTMAYQGLGAALASERPDDAIRVVEKAIRLSPRDPQMHLFLHQQAVAELMAGRYAEAARREQEALRHRVDQPHVYRVLAAALGHLGRADEARAALERARALAPHFTLATFRRVNSAPLVERCLEGWRLAGAPLE